MTKSPATAGRMSIGGGDDCTLAIARKSLLCQQEESRSALGDAALKALR